MNLFKSLMLTIMLMVVAPLMSSFTSYGAAWACGGPCPEPEPPKPEPEPEPETPAVKVENSDRDPAVVTTKCTQVQADRKKYSEALENELVDAYKTAAKTHDWAHVWIKGGRIIGVVYQDRAVPEGAIAWQLTQMPFIDDNRACVKPGDGLPVVGLKWG